LEGSGGEIAQFLKLVLKIRKPFEIWVVVIFPDVLHVVEFGVQDASADTKFNKILENKNNTQIVAFQKKQNHLACNPDLGRAVALSVPRSAFLAEKQPPGASRSLPSSKSPKE
jgi:hypothetical protein